MKFELDTIEPVSFDNEELAKIILARFGLTPKKRDSEAALGKVILELYEKKKESLREKKPELSVLSVESMAALAGIKRQTMYEYLSRFLSLNILKKTSFVSGGKIIIGYELNGNNLESAFRKAEYVLKAHVDYTFKLIEKLQNEIKKEKIKSSIANKLDPSQIQEDFV